MVAIITNKFRFMQAQIFKESLDNDSPTAPKHYLFVGRPQPWTTASVNADLIPDVPSDTTFNEKRLWDNMMGLKKILPNNTSFVVPRWNWDTTGSTVYVPYSDQDPNLFTHPTNEEIQNSIGKYTPGSFYVINQYFQVFKCLSNNAGSKSTIEPQINENTPLVLVSTSDGYVWKYMYTIGTSDAVKYLTDHWMPVKFLTEDDTSAQWDVQEGAVDNGTIDSIQIISGGSQYERVLNTCSIQEITTDSFSNQVIKAGNLVAGMPGPSPSNSGGFYIGSTLWITEGSGAGGYAKIISYDGSTKQITLQTPIAGVNINSKFQVLPTVTVSGDGSGAVAQPIIDFSVTFPSVNRVSGVKLINPGSGYNYATATITDYRTNPTDSTLAKAVVVLPPPGGHGSNAVEELGGHYVMINVKLDYNEGSGDFPISNDYRQIGIIRGPEAYNQPGIPFTGLTAISSSRLRLNNLINTFAVDSIVSQAGGSASGWVIEVLDSGVDTKDLVYIQIPETGYSSFTNGNSVSSGGASGTIVSQINPEVEKYTGDVIYFENRRPVLRAPDQLETIRVIVEF